MGTQLLIDETGHIDEVNLKGDCVRPGCLGQLRGPICDWRDSTRNDHYYTQNHWHRVFNLNWVKEAMETNTLFGEADHPKDRLEASLVKAAVVLVDYQERPEQSDYLGTFDILDTPCGRILRTLAEYGCKLGVSSRGKGSLKKINGRNTVDEDSYLFGGFDVVALPAVKKARQDFIKESVEFDSMTESFKSQIDNCDNLSELNIMKEMLSNTEAFSDLIEKVDTKINMISTHETSDSEDNTIIEGLSRDLKSAYAKINEQEEVIRKYDSMTSTNTISQEESMDNLQQINDLLTENQSCHQVIKSLQADLKGKNELINRMKSNGTYGTAIINHDRLVTLKEQVHELHNIVGMKTKRLDEQTKELESVKSELSRTTELLSKSNEEVTNKSEKLEVLEEEYYELKDELEVTRNELDKTTNELSTICSSHTKMKESSDACLKELTDRNADLEAAKFDISSLEEQLNKANELLHSRTTELDKLTEKVETISESLNNTTDELNNTTDELNNTTDELNKYKSYLLNSNKDYEVLNDKFTDLSDKYDKVSSELDETLDDYNDLVDSVKELFEENKKLKLIYINQQSNKIGMTSESLISKLPDNYSLNDINNLVESMFNTKRKVKMLPIASPKFRDSKQIVQKSTDSSVNEEYIQGLSVARSMLQQMK